MKPVIYLVWSVGFALFVAIILWQGWAEVARALAVAGWGLVWVALFHLVPLIADAWGWRALLKPAQRPSLRTLSYLRWISESVNSLLPVAQVGGDVVRARWLTRHGVPGAVAGASVVVDVTAGVVTQIVFALLGVALLLDHGGGDGAALEITLGLILFSLLAYGFYLAQRLGLFLRLARGLERMAGGRDFLTLTGGAASLDQAVIRLYQRPRGFWICCAGHGAGWLLGAGEVWLALYFLGHPVTLAEAVLLESLIQAIRGAAFAIPGALGVQEGGLIVLGAMIGLAPDTALALSLVKRVRELLLGLPGLLAWQIMEGQVAWRKHQDIHTKEGHR